jgi:hypothetical protein
MRAQPLRRLVRAAARLVLLLNFGAAQAVFAAHVHEIPAPARASAVRRAEPRECSADCPICQLAAQARSVAAPAPAAAPVLRPAAFVASASTAAPSLVRAVRAAARAPPVGA